MSDLSREKLLALLAEMDKKDLKKVATCTYKPARGEIKQCESEATLPWGVCTKHKNTIHARKAKKLYDDAEEERNENEKKEVVQAEKETLLKEAEKESKEAKAKLRKKTDKDASGSKNKDASGSKNKEERPVVRLIVNEFGNFEHSDTGIVFDVETKKAYGVQKKNGRVVPLSKLHVEICRKNGWPYQIPAYYEESDEEEEVVESNDEETDPEEESEEEGY